MVEAWHPGEAVSMAELRRPKEGRMIAGVCAGIADRYGWSRTGVRVIALLSCLLPGPQFVLYIVLWALFPNEQQPAKVATS
jgi:phage shock protein PspC (stress-responsive transcriptional regulator)